MPTFNDAEQDARLKELRARDEENLAQMLSQKYGVTYLDLSQVPINTEALQLIPENVAHAASAAAFDRIGKKISVALRSPGTDAAKNVIADLEQRGYEVTQYMVSEAGLIRAWERYKDLSFALETKEGVLDISGEEIRKLLSELKTIDDSRAIVEKTVKMKRAYRISRILEIVLAGGLSVQASDIHIEPEDTQVRLRYRLDGVLIDVTFFDRETYDLLLSRIKLMSGLKINIKDSAQDGRFSVRIDQHDMEIRTSVIPGTYGESIVMRLLDPKTLVRSMEEVGLQDKLLSVLDHEIRKPNGMILVTGPTGSGKTTTLYAFLRRVYKPEIKIITIEDPVEYHLEGLVQTQVDEKKYSFATGLRSALRQDPDIIMVGEIRDPDVADTAINAALTGHLVFSTLHTNNAAGSFPRLIDLSINPKVIGSAINIVLAQRLVRILCPTCKKAVPLAGEQKKLVDDVLTNIEDKSLIPKNTTTAWEPVGCPQCNGIGYQGRIGIFEAILMNETIEKLVEQSSGDREINEAARSQGLLTIRQDGIVKVLKGITSIDELTRVADMEEN
jgi:type IV pilus assembly protein PilB